MRRLTPELLAALTPAKSKLNGKDPCKRHWRLAGDVRSVACIDVAGAENGESIVISSTKGADPARVTAIAVVSGVGPLLQNNQGGRASAVSLGAMSLGGP